jgi:hypothetical protein
MRPQISGQQTLQKGKEMTVNELEMHAEKFVPSWLPKDRSIWDRVMLLILAEIREACQDTPIYQEIINRSAVTVRPIVILTHQGLMG